MSNKIFNTIKGAFLLFAFFFFCETNAQKSFNAPGYQGKKISFHYELKPALDWFRMSRDFYDKLGQNNGTQFYTFRHNFSIHYVTSKSASTGLSVLASFQPRYYRSNDNDELRSVKGAELGLSYRYSLGGSLLPLGNYFELEPFVFFGKYETLGEYQGIFYSAFAEPAESYDSNFGGGGLALNVGKQWIIADRIIPSYVFGVRMYFKYFGGKSGAQQEAQRILTGNFFGSNFITLDFKLGLGILLF